MSDAVENNLLRGRLSALNRILLRIPVYKDMIGQKNLWVSSGSGSLPSE